MSGFPLVSIITPCYNSERYIGRYLSRILLQTYDNIELIVINDGSTDYTEKIIMEYKNVIEERGYRLTYIKQENKGLGGAIQQGLKAVKGDYFCWCDSDNFYSNDYVEKNICYFDKDSTVSVVRCDGYIVHENNINEICGVMSKGETDKFNRHIFERCLMAKNFHFGCAMVKTSDFDMINPSRDIYQSREGQNWQILLPMTYFYSVGYIDEPLFYFVFRQDSVSNITSTLPYHKMIEQNNEYCKIILKTLASYPIEDKNTYSMTIQEKYENIKLSIYYSNSDYDGFFESYNWLKNNKRLNCKVVLKSLGIRSKLVRYIFSLCVPTYKAMSRIVRGVKSTTERFTRHA